MREIGRLSEFRTRFILYIRSDFLCMRERLQTFWQLQTCLVEGKLLLIKTTVSLRVCAASATQIPHPGLLCVAAAPGFGFWLLLTTLLLAASAVTCRGEVHRPKVCSSLVRPFLEEMCSVASVATDHPKWSNVQAETAEKWPGPIQPRSGLASHWILSCLTFFFSFDRREQGGGNRGGGASSLLNPSYLSG